MNELIKRRDHHAIGGARDEDAHDGHDDGRRAVSIEADDLARRHAAVTQAIGEAQRTARDLAIRVGLALEGDGDAVGMLQGAREEVRLDRAAPRAVQRLLWERSC